MTEAKTHIQNYKALVEKELEVLQLICEETNKDKQKLITRVKEIKHILRIPRLCTKYHNKLAQLARESEQTKTSEKAPLTKINVDTKISQPRSNATQFHSSEDFINIRLAPQFIDLNEETMTTVNDAQNNQIRFSNLSSVLESDKPQKVNPARSQINEDIQQLTINNKSFLSQGCEKQIIPSSAPHETTSPRQQSQKRTVKLNQDRKIESDKLSTGDNYGLIESRM